MHAPSIHGAASKRTAASWKQKSTALRPPHRRCCSRCRGYLSWAARRRSCRRRSALTRRQRQRAAPFLGNDLGAKSTGHPEVNKGVAGEYVFYKIVGFCYAGTRPVATAALMTVLGARLDRGHRCHEVVSPKEARGVPQPSKSAPGAALAIIV